MPAPHRAGTDIALAGGVGLLLQVPAPRRGHGQGVGAGGHHAGEAERRREEVGHRRGGVVEGGVVGRAGVAVHPGAVGSLGVGGEGAGRRQHADQVPVADAGAAGQGLVVATRRPEQVADDEVLELAAERSRRRGQRRRELGHVLHPTRRLGHSGEADRSGASTGRRALTRGGSGVAPGGDGEGPTRGCVHRGSSTAAWAPTRAATAGSQRVPGRVHEGGDRSSVGVSPARLLAPARRLLLVVEAGGDLLGVALVVELEQPVEHLGAGRRAEGEAPALGRVPEAVIEVEVGPAVGVPHGEVEGDVQVAQLCRCRVSGRRGCAPGCRSWSAPRRCGS